jgi:hypothetical protein
VNPYAKSDDFTFKLLELNSTERRISENHEETIKRREALLSELKDARGFSLGMGQVLFSFLLFVICYLLFVICYLLFVFVFVVCLFLLLFCFFFFCYYFCLFVFVFLFFFLVWVNSCSSGLVCACILSRPYNARKVGWVLGQLCRFLIHTHTSVNNNLLFIFILFF